jgi:hypothetical protein
MKGKGIMTMNTTRRRFLEISALATSGAALNAGAVEPKKRRAGDLLKIGVILGEYAHSTGWAALTNGINGDTTSPKRTGMIYTNVWHINPAEAESFARRYGVDTVVKSFDGMVGKVDGLIIDAVMQTPWVYKLAEPYLANGIPVFSDRPGNDAVWKVKRLIELARKHNTPFWSGSSLELMYQGIQAREHHPPETISGYETWSEGAPSFYCHGLHGMWWTHKITGGGISAVSQQMKDWSKGGGISTVFHKDRGKGAYTGTIRHEKRENCLIWTKFAGSEQAYRYDSGHWENFVYLPLLLAVQDMFYHGMAKLPETYDSFLEKNRLFLSAFRSHLREKGEPVELDQLDEDWAVGCPWGHPSMCSREVYDAYTRLLGPEKGEIGPG